QVVLGTVSVLAGTTVLLTILQSTPSYIQPRTEKCLVPTLAAEDYFVPVPVLDRLICILVPYFVDCSRTDYGRLVLQLLMTFVAPITLLEMVEGSRLGNHGTMLACLPFASLFSYATGIGIYLPIFFVPLMMKARSRIMATAAASHVPLPRVYAILLAHDLLAWAMEILGCLKASL
ncbi:hypothetical protein BGZ65_007749, partial [Modicella reniformis]